MAEVMFAVIGALVVAQFSALWLRIGRVEDKLDRHCVEDRHNKSIIRPGGD